MKEGENNTLTRVRLEKAQVIAFQEHSRWNCKYHIVFVPKYFRKAIYGKLRAEIGAILRQLCAYKDVEIIKAHAMPHHIQILVKIPPKLAVSNFMGYLKGKSSLMIFERFANLKYKFGNKVFWVKGFAKHFWLF